MNARSERGRGWWGAACLVVAHRRTVLERADRVVVLRDGHVAGIGTLRELLPGNAEMRSLWSAST